MTGREKVSAWVAEALRSAFRPVPKLRIWEWLARNVQIPAIVGSPIPGPWRLSTFPPVKGILEAYADREVHFLTICKSARVGGTLITILLILWKVINRPGPILMVDPTAQTARRFSNQEFQKFCTENPVIDDIRSRSREGWTKQEMEFSGCFVGLVGSNSPAVLAGRNVEDLHLNELDKYPDDPKKEAPPAELAVVRTNQFHQTRKVIRNSTPTVAEGLTWQYFLKGSQEFCYVPCPLCRHKQRLTFFPEDRIGADGKPRIGPDGKNLQTGRVKFEHLRNENGEFDADRVEREAVYECEECKGHIPQKKQREMVAAYEWRAHNPKAPRDTRSFHLSALYAPFFTWGQLAKKFLSAKGNLGAMHSFFNSELGLPFKHEKASISRKTIENAIKTSPRYRRGELTFVPEIISLAVDVQGQAQGLWWAVLAMHPEDNSQWLLDWGEARNFDDIDSLLDKTWVVGKEKVQVGTALIDMGHRTSEVYEFCSRHFGRAFPYQGRHAAHGQFRPVVETELDYEGVTLTLYQALDGYFKDELYVRRLLARAGRGLFLPQLETSPGKGDGVDDVLIEQLTDEHKGEDGKWRDTKNNHLGDCLKQALVLDHCYQIALRVSADEAEADPAPIDGATPAE